MTKQETQTIANIIERLKQENCGCSHGPSVQHRIDNSGINTAVRGDIDRVAVVSRLYLDMWIIGALECLLPGENRNPNLAVKLSGK